MGWEDLISGVFILLLLLTFGGNVRLVAGPAAARVVHQKPDTNVGKSPSPDPVQSILNFVVQSTAKRQDLSLVESNWNMAFVPMILESVRLMAHDDPRTQVFWNLLETKTKQRFGSDFSIWMKWLWKQEFTMQPGYSEFKAVLHAYIDPRFHWWFYRSMPHSIRLDEIMWGGVNVDGIPPLEHPKVIDASEARYLGKKNVVFGVFINGEARAYPKRILAWHELFNDTVGGVDVTCAHCTLCGAAVLYDQKIGKQKFDFGTSGFLYRSNKLMYDRQTRSLWSSLEGVPVTGKLVSSGLKLNRLPIVTTTWEAWLKDHLQTKVLSLETGFHRDYGEGVAYKDYFPTDELMFPVAFQNSRIRNKQEILAVLLNDEPVAFSTRFLKKNPMHLDAVGKRPIVVLTDRAGANRVYDASAVKVSTWDQQSKLVDNQGQVWQVKEDELTSPNGSKRLRPPAHRAFWFGWQSPVSKGACDALSRSGPIRFRGSEGQDQASSG